jgi:predicted TIM-barrel fold metal-dependent hydrolase
MTIVDIWCNVFTERGIDSLFRSPAEVAEVVGWWGMQDRLRGRPVDEFVKHMDENEVDAVLIPSARMASYATRQLIWNVPDEDVHELTVAAPGRVYGLVGIDPYEGMAGVRRLEHWVNQGFVGAHLHPYGFGLPVNDRKFYPFYAKCAELGVPVVMQVGHSAERMPSAMGRPILIDDIALDFPELSIVGTHTGWPWVEELVALAWKHPNVYIGTSAHHPRYWDPSLINFAATRGRGKVLFGTDWPVVDYPDARTAIDAFTMKDEARSLLLGDAAKKLFRLG